MKVIIKLVFMIAIAMAFITIITLITMNNNAADDAEKQSFLKKKSSESVAAGKILMPTKRVSRFLAEHENSKQPKRSDQCKKDNHICEQALALQGRNSTCCNNKCVDLHYDSYNCGKCKKKCLPIEACCRGECVNISYDKRHCGYCNNRCMPRGNREPLCIYGTCDYA